MPASAISMRLPSVPNPDSRSLPQELLLLVLAAAAPTIPLVVKPAMPHGVQPGDLAEEDAAQLFRMPGGQRGQGGAAGRSAAAAQQE